jgi:hypothetical protein
MTTSPELTILNVGHRSCALVRDGPVVMVVDVPNRDSVLKPTLAQLAATHGITAIDSVLISRADVDHISGVIALLCDEDLRVRRLYVNPEPLRQTVAWAALRLAIRDTLRRFPDFEVHSLTSMRTDELDARLPELCVEVLAPSAELAVTGVGGITPGGIRVSASSLSAVIRFSTSATRGVLLAGDMDRVGLDALLAEHPDLGADVLVFPHHGGLPGRADPILYAADLATAVKPEVVVFSHGREHPGKVPTPSREIVAGVRRSVPVAHIACTQLSKGCAAQPPDAIQRYLASNPGPGSCCAGALEFRFSSAGLECAQLAGHAGWVEAHVPRRMCRVIGKPTPAAST